MEGPFSFGAHHGRQVGDTVEAVIHGPVSREDTVILHERMADALAEHGRCYLLVGLAGATTVHPDGRRYANEWNRTHKIDGIAAYGAGFAIRAVTTLIVSAVNLLGRRKTEVVFLADEAEARRWIEARRAAPP